MRAIAEFAGWSVAIVATIALFIIIVARWTEEELD